MTQDELQEIKYLIEDATHRAGLGEGDWMGCVAELVAEVERLTEIAVAAESAMQDIRTVHLDIGGKHRYSLRNYAYRTIEPLRVLLSKCEKI